MKKELPPDKNREYPSADERREHNRELRENCRKFAFAIGVSLGLVTFILFGAIIAAGTVSEIIFGVWLYYRLKRYPRKVKFSE